MTARSTPRRIWFDVLTPKQLLFFAHMMRKLEPRYEILCTSRRYGEVTSLARLHGMSPEIIGRHGGAEMSSKLRAGTERVRRLTGRVLEFAPDVAVSFCSPDAARVAFGLGIRHVAFSDTPHHGAVMRLTLPLVQKLLIPYVIPKGEFTRYGIDQDDITQYRAIDAAITIRRKVDRSAPLPFDMGKGKNILIRPEESHATYVTRRGSAIPIARRLVSEFGHDNSIVVLARYWDQARALRAELGPHTTVTRMRYDGVHLLENTDVFVGSGGTMTAESALMGVPTISYEAVATTILRRLERMRLVRVEQDPGKVASHVRRALRAGPASLARARKFVSQMEDPTDTLLAAIRGLQR
ncbi:MAG: DUF354 domain-containing protein [Thaumarchaeota archaeon]|nr:DUF354 domain-containing protein [Nitrososphaerota archaeon]